MYRFLRRPRWIVSHVVVLAAIIAMINLSMWQVRRLDEKRSLNATIAARADLVPVPLDVALRGGRVARIDDGIKVEYRSVVVAGTYDAAHEFTIPSRTFNGAPGRWLVTPLRWSATAADVLVLRGFVPQAVDDLTPPIDGVEPPEGEVSVRGWIRASQLPEGIQSSVADLGDHQFARIDIARIEKATGRDLLPVYILLGAQQPVTRSAALTMVPLPERSEGPHLGYAVQWAVFAAIALIGYPLVIAKVARGRRTERSDGAADADVGNRAGALRAEPVGPPPAPTPGDNRSGARAD